MINAYAVTVPGELDNVDFTREDAMIPEKPEALLWMDVETTGLDANMCSILEIGLRCTSLAALHELGLIQEQNGHWLPVPVTTKQDLASAPILQKLAAVVK